MFGKDTQVITIGLDGSMTGLQRRDGVDLTQFGLSDINRASEVLWDKDKQQWTVQVKGNNRKRIKLDEFVLTVPLVKAAQKNKPITLDTLKNKLLFGKIATFDTYEEGVEAEIQVLDYLRFRNIFC